jgi:hypothetical protein
MTAMQIIGHKPAHMWKRYNTVPESDLTAASSKLNSYFSNTLITPDDSTKTAQAGSA